MRAGVKLLAGPHSLGCGYRLGIIALILQCTTSHFS